MLGELLGARYKVINVLGAGGFGHTYIAEDTQRPGNPHCVLKHLTFASTNSQVLQQVRQLFQVEAETLEELGKHDQIPRLLAYFEEKQEFYLVQEYVEGQPLSEELAGGKRFSEPQVVALLKDVLEILQYVHAQGVIHRDIKPENLIRRRQDNKLVLIDFGAVKTIGSTVAEASGETQLSVPIYTSGYGASEQCLGKPQFCSDLYSLGMVAIQALTGLRPSQLPQDLNTYEIVWHDRASVSQPLAAVIDRMVCFHFSRRYQSATEVLQALNQATLGSATVIPPAATVAFSQFSDSPRSVADAQSLHTSNDRPTQPRILPSRRRVSIAVATIAIALTAGILGRGILDSAKVPVGPISEQGQESTEAAIHNRISTGEKLLNRWQTNPDPHKQEGVEAIAAKNYGRATAALEAARQRNLSDPETLIYLNNARIGDAKSYTLAVVVPLGDAFGSAVEILRGVAQAQEEVNQTGGINGVPLKLAIVNDDNQTAIAQQVAKTLVNIPEVLGVIGHSTSDTTLAAAEVYQSGQLVMVSPLSSAVKLSSLGSFIFRTMPSDNLSAKELATYMLDRLKKRKAVVFFNSSSVYSQSLKNEFKNALFYNGVELLDEFDLSRPDFEAYEDVQQAIAKGAEVMMLAPDHQTSDRAIQVVLVNRRRLKLLSGDSVSASKILRVAGAESVGMVLAFPTSLAQSPFRQQFTTLWGNPTEISWRTILAYDAAQALITALQQDPTRRGLQRVMASPGFSVKGAEGDVKFLPSGDRQGKVRLMTVVPRKSGRTVDYEFKLLP